MRWIGHRLHAEAGVAGRTHTSVADGARTSPSTPSTGCCTTVPACREATVHVSPASHDGRDFHAAVAHHFQRGGEPSQS